ncbi:MAG: flagellar hook assembly protein FlgD [Phenylobacterium sp.]
MAVESATAASATSSAKTTTALGNARLAQNFETFLTLLTSQLKNQDPLSPMDSTQFTQQLTQMTGVEQQLLTNQLLQKLVTGQTSGVADAVSLIGKEARALSDQASLSKGKASWIYKLDGDAAQVKMEVLDAAGKVVFAGSPGKTAAGEHTFTWDGKSGAGTALPDGVYKLRITALDKDAKPVDTKTFVEGVVRSVEQTDGQTMISIGGVKVPWDTVSSVQMAEEAAAPTSSTTTAAGGAGATGGSTSDGENPPQSTSPLDVGDGP